MNRIDLASPAWCLTHSLEKNTPLPSILSRSSNVTCATSQGLVLLAHASSHKKKIKKVQFDPVVKGQIIETTEIDLHRAWYSRYDLAYFEERVKQEARLRRRLLKKKQTSSLTRGEAIALELIPSRGIESFLCPEIFQGARLRQRYTVIDRVLKEQQRQRTLGCKNPDDLARVSLVSSFVARERAAERGADDMVEVMSKDKAAKAAKLRTSYQA